MDLIEPLMDAVIHGEEGLLQMYIGMGASLATSCDQQGRGVLHWSAASDSGENLVPYLIAKGAKLNMQDNDGFTPLHIYAITGRTYGLTALLHHGADPNLISSLNSLTPLHVALQHNRSETANMLLCYGAKLIISSAAAAPLAVQTLVQARPASGNFTAAAAKARTSSRLSQSPLPASAAAAEEEEGNRS